ncbi:ANTAR domain-containing response regulator [Pseudorhizobium flavum]|uniref:ANTAR domain-containing response regulator n=1 Tax=Pseudorhizobium flavum TaxID=1335061 RepID=UPI002490FBC4|nr:ANTAR domain-containing response regulator [Pseudorhizobium flavum]
MSQAELTILVIDENAIRASIIEEGLREAGHDRVNVIHEVNGVARTIETLQPDVIIIDIENPNRDMMEHLFQLTRTVGRPIAMFVDRSDTASIEAAVDAGVSAYIVDGLKKERVKSILDMAVSRFNAFARLQRELAEARSALEERKVVERAKGILMKMRGLSEEEAFALLRQSAMNEKKKMADIAQSIVTAARLLL